jgi:hypothetical protein
MVKRRISRKAGATAAVYQRWWTDRLAVATAQGGFRGTCTSVVINRTRGTEKGKVRRALSRIIKALSEIII